MSAVRCSSCFASPVGVAVRQPLARGGARGGSLAAVGAVGAPTGKLSGGRFWAREQLRISRVRAAGEAEARPASEAEAKAEGAEDGGDGPSKSLIQMTNFSERYAKNTGTYFCSDPGVTAVVIKGLAEHKDTLGAPLCPCRHYEDKEAEVAQGFWNCPCVPMRERKECHCMLFLTEDNPFRGDEQTIDPNEVQSLTEEAKGAL
mmetsp:Transcript_6224/g.15325  ORF Transcript_6224/g.15325 Transcript_6224/m.15325 type:complete len:203 (-) Transcript_6224:51-659(-)